MDAEDPEKCVSELERQLAEPRIGDQPSVASTRVPAGDAAVAFVSQLSPS
jgi:hypothetical protein